jgi:threonine aldolase
MTAYTEMMRSDGAETVVDLRSDTVTKPCAEMRTAMAEAPVGDDVYGEDPTVNLLEATAAKLLGKEAALFLASGTQSNLCGVLAHCGRGDEIIIGDSYHVYRNEGGGASVLGGVAYCPLPTGSDGGLDPDAIAAAVKPDDSHHAISRLLSLEDTVSGAALSPERLAAMAAPARKAGLGVHIDGARLFNAATAFDRPVSDFAAIADTVSICLSKGLGAPVGSVLVGSAELVRKARRLRKAVGGGMRQAGVLAAAGLYALTRNVERLKDDHARAARFADELEGLDGIVADVHRTPTNMLFATLRPGIAGGLRAHLAERGVVIGGGETVRLVLHRDIDDDGLDRAVAAFRGFHNRAG